ncbi:hypothetical protein IP88_04070 [alpha proteobacterium AAP81b]|nr:hypothetical protein IP88_04070 [alpha proteobacterium AAP81b]
MGQVEVCVTKRWILIGTALVIFIVVLVVWLSVSRNASHDATDAELTTSQANDIIVTASRKPILGVHTAKLTSDPALGGGAVRAGRVATLTYQLKPPVEVDAGDISSPAANGLLQSILEGNIIEVAFSCYPCAASDLQQPTQVLKIDRASSLSGIRSLPIQFRLTPRAIESPYLKALKVAPHVALTFRQDGYDLDRWVIPIKIMVQGQNSGGSTDGQLQRTFVERQPGALFDNPLVRLRYQIAGDGRGLSVRVMAPAALLPFFQPLANVATVVDNGKNGVLVDLPVARSLDLIEAAGRVVYNDIDEAVQGTGEDEQRCHLPTENIKDQTKSSQALAECVGPSARVLRNMLFPRGLQQVIYNLARCRPKGSGDKAADRTLPTLAIENLPYVPLQVVPVDDIVGTGAACTPGLEPLPTDPIARRGISDNFLGLLLPTVLITRDTLALADREPRMSEAEGTADFLAGIYKEVPATGETQAPAPSRVDDLFDSMDKQVRSTLHGAVARNATEFLKQLVANRTSLSLVLVNSHGQRRGRNEDNIILGTDQIVFSHWAILQNNPDAGVPATARVRSLELIDAFAHLDEENSGLPLTERPTVLLLACDTAPYRKEYSVPFALFRTGAGYVVSTDVAVDTELANQFGQAFLRAFRTNTEPTPVAVFKARRELLLQNGTVWSLLWNVLAAPDVVR